MPSQDVCARPSATRRYSVETVKLTLRLPSPSGSHTILVFHAKRYGSIPTRDRNTPAIGGVKCRGYEKIAMVREVEE